VPFFILLNIYELRDRAGSGLFFILMTFLYLNFFKADLHCVGVVVADPEIYCFEDFSRILILPV
jgi:hypothetical protein